MRSGVGTACPFTRLDPRVELFRDFPDLFAVPVVVLEPALPVAGLCEVLLALVVCATAAAGSIKLPTANAARIKRVIRRLFCNVRIAGLICRSIVSCPLEPRPEGTWSSPGRRCGAGP